MGRLGGIGSPRLGVASSDPRAQAPVNRGYRQVVAWGLAIVLHLILLALIAGVSLPLPPAPPPSLDVVLVSRPAASPERSSAIAAADQRAASAEAPRAKPPESPAEATAETPAPRSPEPPPDPASEPSSEPEPAPSPAEPAAAEPVSEPVAEPVSEPVSEPKPPALSGRALAASATASLREQDFTMREPPAELADRAQQAARQAAEARYVDAWTRRVQDYGNRFYPAPPELDGQLKVRVVIDHQGKLLQAEVVQSSGHPELDQAALDTIRGAAPYRPFDSGMAGLDRLSISRVWRFGTGNEFGVR